MRASTSERRERRAGTQTTTSASAPAVPLGELGQQRQEDQLPGGRARREQADHEAAPLRRTSGRDRGAEHQGRHAGAEADHHAPEQDELPDLGHARARARARAAIRVRADRAIRRTPSGS